MNWNEYKTGKYWGHIVLISVIVLFLLQYLIGVLSPHGILTNFAIGQILKIQNVIIFSLIIGFADIISDWVFGVVIK